MNVAVWNFAIPAVRACSMGQREVRETRHPGTCLDGWVCRRHRLVGIVHPPDGAPRPAARVEQVDAQLGIARGRVLRIGVVACWVAPEVGAWSTSIDNEKWASVALGQLTEHAGRRITPECDRDQNKEHNHYVL